jgi:hypothetical protein
MHPDAVRLVIERELALLAPTVRASATTVDELLDPEFREVGVSGRLWSRDEIVAALAAERAERHGETTATELQATVLSPELVLLTYVSERDGRRARRMSLWRRSAGTWRVLYHQGTLLDSGAD